MAAPEYRGIQENIRENKGIQENTRERKRIQGNALENTSKYREIGVLYRCGGLSPVSSYNSCMGWVGE